MSVDQARSNKARVCLKVCHCDESAIYRLIEMSSTQEPFRKQPKVKERGKHILPHLISMNHSSFLHKQELARISKNKQSRNNTTPPNTISHKSHGYHFYLIFNVPGLSSCPFFKISSFVVLLFPQIVNSQ